ncbi:MAG: chemotaxis protein CheW [Spirochaetales bacterium]|nr:chemotaxis protein CheW [Spirochaetales bacterium]
MKLQSDNYVTLSLDKTMFAINVSHVREVLEYRELTLIPKTADFVKGVINLRGSVVPVIDLRMKFSMETKPVDIDTAIIILELFSENTEDLVLGVIADKAHEVLEIDPSQTDAAPRLGNSIHVDFIKSIARKNEHFIMILDIEKIFLSDELVDLSQDITRIKDQIADDDES